MIVVKANAYGHGAMQVAKTSLANGATWLGVYTVEEGVTLRHAGIEAPILVFGPLERLEAEEVFRLQLTATVSGFRSAELLQTVSQGRRIPVHLKIDTGLARAGMSPEEGLVLLKALHRFPTLQVQGLYTHFASADERNKDLTFRQLRRFREAAERFSEEGFEFQIRHAANSAAMLDVPETHLDMVRVGIAAYGYHPGDASRDLPLRPAMSLLSTVSRVHSIPAGSGVGYGHEFRCSRPTTIALVPIGYGDGLPRYLGAGRGSVIVRAGRAPIVGRVSMDQITIDVSEVANVTSGDEAVVIGSQEGMQQTAEDVAEQAGTISYDIVTGILPRVPRIYVLGGEVVSCE